MYLFKNGKSEEYVLDTNNEMVKKVLEEIDFEGYPLQDFEKDYLIKMRTLSGKRIKFYEKKGAKLPNALQKLEYLNCKLLVINYVLWHEPLEYIKPEIARIYNRTEQE